VAVGMQPFDTLSGIANEELSNFLKGFRGGVMADWEACLHSERDLFPIVVWICISSELFVAVVSLYSEEAAQRSFCCWLLLASLHQ